MDAFPPELLAMIFRAVPGHSTLRVQTAIRCSHVSRHWRAAALADPVLWSDLNPAALKWDVVEALLERTLDSPVVLNFVLVGDDIADRVPTLLAKHLHHIQSLSLVFGAVPRTVQYVAPTLSALCSPAPMMTFLRLNGTAFELPRDLLGGVQKLTSLEIPGHIPIPPICPGLQTVRSLQVELTRIEQAEFQLSQVMPNLASVALSCNKFPSPYRLDQAHNLERLVLRPSGILYDDDYCLSFDMRRHLGMFNHATCGHLVCSSSHEGTISMILDGMPDAQTMIFAHVDDADRFEVAEDVSILLDLSLSSADGKRSRTIHYVDSNVLDDVLPPRTMNITTLRCAHHHLHMDPPRMPQLATFTIDFVSPVFEVVYDQFQMWFDEERAPRLSSVRLIKGPEPDNGEELPTVSGKQLAEALRTRDSSPIEELIGSGLEMEDADEGYEALEAVVRTLIWE